MQVFKSSSIHRKLDAATRENHWRLSQHHCLQLDIRCISCRDSRLFWHVARSIVQEAGMVFIVLAAQLKEQRMTSRSSFASGNGWSSGLLAVLLVLPSRHAVSHTFGAERGFCAVRKELRFCQKYAHNNA